MFTTEFRLLCNRVNANANTHADSDSDTDADIDTDTHTDANANARAGDKTVSAAEFEQGLAALGVSVTAEESLRLVSRFGSDGRVR